MDLNSVHCGFLLLPPGAGAMQHLSDAAANVDYSVIAPRFTTGDRAAAA